ncbi:MAG: phytanoyl-CoA dioxygenase family protein [Sporichthyaceae bacterium]
MIDRLASSNVACCRRRRRQALFRSDACGPLRKSGAGICPQGTKTRGCSAGHDGGVDAPETSLPAALTRDLREDEIESYWRDGAAIVRGVVPLEWIDALRSATQDLMADPATPGVDFAAGSGPRFFTLTYAWRYHPVFRDWALRGPMIELARQVLPRAQTMTLFFDQIFAREAGARKTTPFHQDAPYTPATEPDHYFRQWVPLDVVTARSGAVHYLRGSHRGPTYRARSFDEQNAVAAQYDTSERFLPLPDFDTAYADYEWLVGEVEPGDVILHHPGTVHGTLPATESVPRRAVTTMYADDTVRWDPHDSHAFHNEPLMGHQPFPDLAAGDRLACELFPQVWQSQS